MAALNEVARLSQAAQAKMGLPDGFALYSPFPFGGMNYQASRIAIADSEWRWRENFIRIGDGNLRTVPDIGAAVFTGDGTPALIYFFWFNIGPTNYCALFFDDGTAVQIDGATGAQTNISAALGTFYIAGGGLPACVSWGSQYLLISNNNTFNDYWIWDGTVLYTAGGAGPVIDITSGGTNYSSLPTVTAFGGQGSGIVAVPTILNGSVNTVLLTAPGMGYVPGDTVQLQFSGGGSDTGAILQALLNSGSVASVSVTAGGSGYGSPPSVTFSAPAGSTATGTTAITGQYVTSVTITSPGGGYITPPAVTFTGGGGVGAVGHAVLSGGVAVSVVLTDHGHGYTSAPAIAFAAPPPGVTATGTAVLTTGAVTSVTITNSGSGYVTAPTITFGSGAAAATAFLGASGVAGVSVVDGGTGYTFPPPLSFVGGNGTGAAATAILTATKIAYINVTSGGGPGYTAVPTVVFNNTGSGGTGAAATAVIADGRVVGIQLTNAGSGYTSPPLISFTGGGLPTGEPQATAQAVLVGTSIASVIMGNQGHGYTQASAVVVAPGSNNAASAILEMMPYGVSGSSIESFDQRVWLPFPKPRTSPTLTGNVFLVTAPGSITDFATSNGGLTYKSNSPFLRAAYTTMKTVGDFLYPIGDSSVDVISNVQTSGSPSSTTFNYNNTDPQVGTNWRESIRDFGRTALLANAIGVYGLYGGAVTKLSDKLDDLFENAIFPPTAGAITPSAAVAEVHEKKVYLLLMTVVDLTGTPRTVLVTWDEQEWCITSQSTMPTFINTRIVNGVPTAWGTDGLTLFPLLATPSNKIRKILSTKLYGANTFPAVKLALSLHLMAEDLSTTGAGVLLTGTLDTENTEYPLPSPLNFGAGANSIPVVAGYTGDIYGDFLGLTLSSTSADFTLKHLVIGYRLVWGGFGSFDPQTA